jgi:hypothetical protein
VPHIDARDWLPDDHFIDAHHLFAVGACQFSQRLANELLGPLFNEGDLSAVP